MRKASKSSPDLLQQDVATTLKSMTIPMIIGMIMLMTFGLVDTFFISLLGTDELAAISFTFPVTFTVISLTIGLGIGTSAVIARLLGAKLHEQAKETATGALMLSFILAVFLALIGVVTVDPIFSAMGATAAELVHIKDYMYVWYAAGVFLAMPMVGNSVLRASGDTKTPSYVMAFGGLINAILDPLLIFGWGPVPALGIKGAAIATLIAWAVGLFYILYLLAIKRQLMQARLLNLQELKRSSGGILKIGLPAAGANMLTPIAAGVVTSFIASYGQVAVAAWGVGGRLESIACIVILSLSMSLPPFISQNLGANKLERVQQAFLLSVKFVVVWQLVIYAVVVLCAGLMANIFTDDHEVAELITLFLWIVPLGYGCQGVIILANSSFNAMHLPMSALVLNLVRLFVAYIPFAFIGSHFFGLTGIFVGIVFANIIVAVVAFIWFKQVMKAQVSKFPL
ncbi:MAG: MATE family efflux transporter [Paraglaciecola sp.]|nr:MATE family efflux transporter [Paraglaciecola sp.]MDP5032290.1 MATE family efflux transporter [Paraglaciecola sp.]MDP5131218.1 MATE family efflux transporter [Paraglaciecola sp.]